MARRKSAAARARQRARRRVARGGSQGPTRQQQPPTQKAVRGGARPKMQAKPQRRQDNKVVSETVFRVQEPLAVNVASVTGRNRRFIVPFSDLITKFRVSGHEPDELLGATPMAPQFFTGTQLKTLAEGFQEYRFLSLGVEVVSALPQGQASGSYVHGCVMDPTDVPLTQGIQTTQFVKALEGSVISSYGLTTSTFPDCRQKETRFKWFQTSPTASISEAAQFMHLFVNDVPVANVTGDQYVTLVVFGQIEFIKSKAQIPTDISGSFLVPTATQTPIGPHQLSFQKGWMTTKSLGVPQKWKDAYSFMLSSRNYQIIPPINFATATDAPGIAEACYCDAAPSTNNNIYFYDTVEHCVARGAAGLVEGSTSADFALTADTILYPLEPELVTFDASNARRFIDQLHEHLGHMRLN